MSNVAGVDLASATKIVANGRQHVPPVPAHMYSRLFAQIDTIVNKRARRETTWIRKNMDQNGSATTWGIAGEPVQRDYYFHIASNPAIRTICEVGFNAGHSTAVWSLANPRARIINFDRQTLSYGPEVVAFLKRTLANFTMVVGDSTASIPAFIQRKRSKRRVLPRCDLVHVDGGHTYKLAWQDTLNLLPLMDCSTTIMMDDTCDPFHCHCRKGK